MNKKPITIILTGKAGSGKDTVSEILKEKLQNEYNLKVLELAYGDYLKAICSRNFGYNEEKKAEYRNIIQHFGTEVCRKKNPNIWVNTVWNLIDTLKEDYDVFIITDGRFQNELTPTNYLSISNIYNIYVKNDRESNQIKKEDKIHSSETLATNPNLDKFDIVIENNKTLAELGKKIDQAIVTILQKNDKEIKLDKLNFREKVRIDHIESEKANHLKKFIGYNGYIISSINRKDGIRYKVALGNNETAYFKRSELKRIEK